MEKYIVAGRLIDGSGGEIKKRTALVVDQGRIRDVIAAESLPSDRPEALIDLSHCTLMPPLMDCSVDIARSPSIGKRQNSKKNDKERAAVLSRHIHFCHSHGVLGVADCAHGDDGCSTELIRDVDEAVTIRTANQVYHTGRHDKLTDVSESADFVKIIHTDATEAIGNREADTVDAGNDNLLKLVRQASERGKQTVVVVNGNHGVAEALRAGCDAIEQGYDMGGENLEDMASRKILWIPALVRLKNHLEMAPSARKAEIAEQLKKQQSLLRQARSLGVPVAVGTGAGSNGIIHGESVLEEIKQLMKSGYSLVEALRAGSLIGAEFFKVPEIGILQSGSPANFIVSRGMVQQLPRKLSYLENIYWHGDPSRWYRKNPVKTVSKN